MVDISEIFLGFCRYYSTLQVLHHESLRTNTMRIVSYFDELGRMLGYRIYSEQVFKTLFQMAGKKCPKNMKRKMPDIVWGHLVSDKEVKYKLVLESEQKMDDERITAELEKLVVFPSELKVLYCSHDEPEDVIDLARKVAKRKRKNTEGLLLIIDPWTEYPKFSEGKLRGYMLGRSDEILSSGEAQVLGYEDGKYQVRLFKDAKWYQ